MLSCLAAFATWLAVSLWVHHRNMLKALNQPDATKAVDTYITSKLTRWENETLMRILTGVVLTILSVLFIFYKSEKHWFAISASLLIAFILFCMLKSWSYYLDSLLLHDVRRSTRDQEDIST